jgi:hypothetical protein
MPSSFHDRERASSTLDFLAVSKQMRGVQGRVASYLGVDRSFVYKVAKGQKKSRRVLDALAVELNKLGTSTGLSGSLDQNPLTQEARASHASLQPREKLLLDLGRAYYRQAKAAERIAALVARLDAPSAAPSPTTQRRGSLRPKKEEEPRFVRRARRASESKINYSEVARHLGVSASAVRRVALGTSKSRRILDYLQSLGGGAQ